MKKKILTELRHEKDLHKRWKQGEVTQEELLTNIGVIGLQKLPWLF